MNTELRNLMGSCCEVVEQDMSEIREYEKSQYKKEPSFGCMFLPNGDMSTDKVLSWMITTYLMCHYLYPHSQVRMSEHGIYCKTERDQKLLKQAIEKVKTDIDIIDTDAFIDIAARNASNRTSLIEPHHLN